MDNDTPNPNAAPPAAAASNSRRWQLLLLMAGALVAAGLGALAWWAIHGRYHETTDDAYVAGNVVQITPQVAGTVLAIQADDTDFVAAGRPLVMLDPADAKVALEQAEAQLAQTVREVRNLFANSASLKANVALREADVAKARDDLARRQGLVASGAVSREEIEHARTALSAAAAALAAAREQLAANQALIDDTTVQNHPNVMRAAARVHEAYLAYERTTIPAPVSGFVAKRSVQVGSRVAPGQPLMAIVPLNQVWVDANFKEVQLRNMRIGQPVTLSADVYGSRAEYHGKVVGLGAGTGAAFSLLPAQNATGNWIKVVQRVPVRIGLDSRELAAHPLRVGLSMQADVDVEGRNGAQLASAARSEPVAATAVFDDQGKAAQARVKSIIAANLGAAASDRAKLAQAPRGALAAAAPAAQTGDEPLIQAHIALTRWN
jgi:membrane fusion protein, multidrug efflux system